MNFVCRCKASARPRLIQTILFGRLTQVISPEGTSISGLSNSRTSSQVPDSLPWLPLFAMPLCRPLGLGFALPEQSVLILHQLHHWFRSLSCLE